MKKDVPGTNATTTVSDDALERFTRAFEVSAKRWELIVYPSLFAFILLAGYGFYIIYNMTNDVHLVTQQMTPIVQAMEAVSDNMLIVSENMSTMSTNMNTIAGDMEHMSSKFDEGVAVAERIDKSVATMVPLAQQMTYDMDRLTYRVHDVTRPMSTMSGFMP